MPATSTPTLADLHAAMIAAGGRDVDGAWHSTLSGITLSCLHYPDQRPHDMCVGWINPAAQGAGHPCYCPCHDGQRMPHDQARAIVLARLAAKTAA